MVVLVVLVLAVLQFLFWFFVFGCPVPLAPRSLAMARRVETLERETEWERKASGWSLRTSVTRIINNEGSGDNLYSFFDSLQRSDKLYASITFKPQICRVCSWQLSYKISGFKWFYSFQHGVVIKADQRMPTSDTPCTPEEHTVDDVIIWAPLTTSSNLALWCPFCAECSGLNRPLKATRWKNGKTTCDQPRPLYGLTNNALLVSRV